MVEVFWTTTPNYNLPFIIGKLPLVVKEVLVVELVEEEGVVLTGTVTVPTVSACVTVTNRTTQIAASPAASESWLTCCLHFLGLLLQDRWHLCQRGLSVHQFRGVS